MKNRELAELLKYSSPNNILVIDWTNRLIELYCPFKVQIKQDVGDLKQGELEVVSLVKLATNFKTVFIIDNKAYFYFHFDILVE